MTTRTPEERATYWKAQARKHEDRNKASRLALTRARNVLEVVLDSLDDALDPEGVQLDDTTVVQP